MCVSVCVCGVREKGIERRASREGHREGHVDKEGVSISLCCVFVCLFVRRVVVVVSVWDGACD